MSDPTAGPAPDPEPLAPAAPARVAMVIQRFRPAFSGQAVQVEALCGALARRGVAATVITAVHGRAAGTERCDGWEIRRLRVDLLPGSGDRSQLWVPTFGARVAAALTRVRPDIVHVHGPTDGLYGAWLYSRLARVPAIAEMTLQGDDDPVTMRDRHVHLRRLRWAVYRRFDAWVAMSEAFLESARRAGLPEARVHVIPQGVDTDRFRPPAGSEKAQLRARLGLAEGAPLVVFLGSLVRRKGLDVLLRAWPAVLASVPGARLVLAGRDEFPPGSPEAAFVDEALGALPEDARDSVSRMGLIDDPERLLRAADAFVFPSRQEGFGSVIIEAMASGLPCVVSELPGITDLIFATPEGSGSPASVPGADGIVVPQGEPDAVAAALVRLLREPSKAAAMGMRARQRAEQHFALPRIVDAYLRLYREILAGRLR